jgi:hypothetical protein
MSGYTLINTRVFGKSCIKMIKYIEDPFFRNEAYAFRGLHVKYNSETGYRGWNLWIRI